MHPTQQVQERLADVATGTPFLAWLGVNLTQLNQVLETLTLIVGLVAGCVGLAYRLYLWRKAHSADKDSKADG